MILVELQCFLTHSARIRPWWWREGSRIVGGRRGREEKKKCTYVLVSTAHYTVPTVRFFTTYDQVVNLP
jgi:hypothetical protein